MNLVEILTGAHVALKLIQARLITTLALLMAFALFAWAMWLQSVLGLMIAATWGLFVFLPVLFAGRGGSDAQEREHPTQEPSVRAAHGARLPTVEPDDD